MVVRSSCWSATATEDPRCPTKATNAFSRRRHQKSPTKAEQLGAQIGDVMSGIRAGVNGALDPPHPSHFRQEVIPLAIPTLTRTPGLAPPRSSLGREGADPLTTTAQLLLAVDGSSGCGHSPPRRVA